jgi:glycerol-3-phosphate dehydrogenase (NAD+)
MTTLHLFKLFQYTGHKLPENIVAVPDIAEAAADADVLIFVLPHQFIKRVCQPLGK